MNRHFLMLRLTVKDGERAFLMRNGRFEQVLEPGPPQAVRPAARPRGRAAPGRARRVPGRAPRRAQGGAARSRRRDVRGGGDQGRRGRHRQPRRPAVAPDGSVADAACSGRSRPRVEVERIDVAGDPKVAPRHLAMVARERNTLVAEHVVENHEAGLLFVEGRLVERLAPGRHAFWTAGRKIEVKRLDLRPQAVEITAQEMLTKDRIALRVTLTAFRRIVDPERLVSAVPDVDAWLYRLVQFAIREAVASRTLDEVLSAKNALDAELRAYVRERVAETGIEVTGARREGRDPARRDPRAREQGGGGGADGEGQPDPPPGGDGGHALAAQHRQADGGQPAPPAAQGARSRSSGWSRRSAASISTPATARASTRCSPSSCA